MDETRVLDKHFVAARRDRQFGSHEKFHFIVVDQV